MTWESLGLTGEEPVSVAEVSAYVRPVGASENALLGTLITAAREYCERETGRAIAAQDIRGYLGGGPIGSEVVLPLQNAVGITSLEYVYFNGDPSAAATGPYIATHDGQQYVGAEEWPSGLSGGQFVVEYTAGFDPEDVAGAIKLAIMMLVSHWYDNRSALNATNVNDETKLAVVALLQQHRVYGV